MNRCNRTTRALLAAAVCLSLAAPLGAYVPDPGTATAAASAQSFDSLVMVWAGVEHHKQGQAALASATQVIDKVNAKFGLGLKIDRISRSGLFVVGAPAPLSVDKYVNAANYVYATFPQVKVLQPNFRYEPLQVSGRTPADALWNLKTRATANAGSVNAQAAWPMATGRGVNIAILDTGVVAHPQVASNFSPRWAPPDGADRGYPYYAGDFLTTGADFTYSWWPTGADPRDADDVAWFGYDGLDAMPEDRGDWTGVPSGCRGSNRYAPSSWHGTHVAGTAAAQWSNGNRWSGVAPDASITPVRVLGKCFGDTASIVDGIRWAAGLMDDWDALPVGGVNPAPARVINMSLGLNVARALNQGGAGGRISVQGCRLRGNTSSGAAMLGERAMAEQLAITAATEAGTVVVVAAGNDASDIAQSAPAACDNVIAVGSVRADGNRAYYSNFDGTPSSQLLDVMAPGGEMRLTYPNANDEPSTLPEGIIGYTWYGSIAVPLYGYLNADARACVARPTEWSGSVWGAWQVRRESGRWYCVNDTFQWRLPLLVTRTGGILASVRSTGAGGSRWGVFAAQAGQLEYMQGTSMAAPHVAGVVALMLSARPDLTPVQVETALKQSARRMTAGQCSAGQTSFPVTYLPVSGNPGTTQPFPGTTSTTSPCGAGIVDAAAAVQAALAL